jgi:hypothetical protein
MSKQATITDFVGMFHMPYIAGTQYAPGIQPSNPGESVAPHTGALFNPLGWPTAVPVLNMLIGNPGVARARAPVPVNDRYASLPENYLFIAGISGKSQG